MLEFACTKRKITGCNLVAKAFADLTDAEWQLFAHRTLYVLEIDENALRCLRAKVDRVRARFRDALKRLEHQIKLTNIRVIAFAATRTGNGVLVDQFFHLVE
ncbi:hypothetical protein D3C71_1796070 [compost metagenome]